MRRKEHKIINMIVFVIAVLMVYAFCREQIAVEMFGHNVPADALSLPGWFVIGYFTSVIVVAVGGAVMACNGFEFFASGAESLFAAWERALMVKSSALRLVNAVAVKCFHNAGSGDVVYVSNFLHGEVLSEV